MDERATKAGRRLAIAARAAMAAGVAAFAVSLVASPGGDLRIGSDLASFLGAGTLVWEGRGAELWDPTAQREAQQGLTQEPGTWIPFAYPAPVALAYAPLSRLPLRAAHAVHFAGLLAALAGAVWLMARRVPLAARDPLTVFCVIGTFLPMYRSLTGGQNPPLSLLLLAAVWVAVAERRALWAGVAAGLLCCKPQLGLPVVGLLLLWDARAALAAGAVVVALYVAGAAVAGFDWGLVWTSELLGYQQLLHGANAPKMVSVLGFAQALLGPESGVALLLGGVFTLGTVGLLAWVWWRARLDIDGRMALTVAGLVLLSPHTLHYEVSLCALPVLVWVQRGGAGAWALGIGGWLAGGLFQAAEVLPASPLFPLALAVFALWVRELVRTPARHGVPA